MEMINGEQFEGDEQAGGVRGRGSERVREVGVWNVGGRSAHCDKRQRMAERRAVVGVDDADWVTVRQRQWLNHSRPVWPSAW